MLLLLLRQPISKLDTHALSLTPWVVEHQVGVGAKGITAVLGPPVHTFPPLFRQNGPYAKSVSS